MSKKDHSREASAESISLDSKPADEDEQKRAHREAHGVVLNSSTYGAATNSFGRNASSGNFLLNSRPRGMPVPLSDRLGHVQLAEIRRPSIIEMVNSGGIIINQRGSPEINLNKVPVPDVEMMYEYHGYRRASMDIHSTEDESGRSFQHGTSSMGSSRQLTVEAAKFTCPSPTQSWWLPKFNSTVLEKHFGKVVIEFIRRRFRIVLMFIALFALMWVVFFSVNIPFDPGDTSSNAEGLNNVLALNSVQYSVAYVVGAVVLFVVVTVLFFLTFTRVYSVTCVALMLSVFLTLVLMASSCALALALYFDADIQGFLTMSFVAQFALTAIIILTMFSLSRLPLIISVALSVLYIIVLEVMVGILAYRRYIDTYPMNVYVHSLIGRVLFYIALILAGVSTAYLLDIRQHATFWKIAQCVLSQEALELERELKEKTILSMMPKPFADELMKVDVQLTFMLKQKLDLEGEENLDPVLQSLSAPFTICSMDTVTILFADIVDFTKFSSGLSAAELVGILNEVFSTFDDLVTKHSCEKISTLGDCYFCVSGCPEPEPTHADNCVNMGLAIIDALEDIRRRTGHPIRMRVGIHTGSVYCGVMGTKRFKFDVWSKDVRIANQIESIGTPGCVLISSSTKSHLSSTFSLEKAEIQHKNSELSDLDLFYVYSQRRHSLSGGGSGAVYRVQDGIHSEDEDVISEPPSSPVRVYPPSVATDVESEERNVFCPFLRKKRGEMSSPGHSLRARDRQASSSIVDIFSKQKQLQKCTSYAELAVPQHHNNGEEVMDRKIVELMEGHNVNFDTYFDPKLKIVTLNFRDADFEATYKDYGRDLDEGSDGDMTETQLGFRIAKQSYMVDTATLFVNYLLIMIGSAACLSSDETFSLLWPAWLGIFLFGLIVELVILFFVFVIFMPSLFPSRLVSFSQFIIHWFVRSLVGLIMIYYPMTVVLVSISRCQTDISETVPGLAHVQMTFFVTIVVLMSSITFLGVSHIAKLIGGFLSCCLFIAMVVGVHLELCVSSVNATLIATTEEPPPPTVIPIDNKRVFTDSNVADYLTNYYTRHVAPEVSILLLLVLILLTVVNRMSEISDRLSFISRLEASARRRFTRQKKVQAEWLLFNIIPHHVAHSLRTTGKFSQNHECVGVMFASIVNFREFLLDSRNDDEQVLRLLNQIITEFDTLLDMPRFSNIEKIKTIGSTYMAASGLNLPPDQPCTVHHLTELIDFAQNLIEVLDQVNRRGFVFRMRIGINYGPVTSGVVGSHKMLYDIWGDTVNVASRMDTTGLVNKIHMPEHCLDRLVPYVSHEVHKIVNVKGKGEMRTVFVTLAPTGLRVGL